MFFLSWRSPFSRMILVLRTWLNPWTPRSWPQKTTMIKKHLLNWNTWWRCFGFFEINWMTEPKTRHLINAMKHRDNSRVKNNRRGHGKTHNMRTWQQASTRSWSKKAGITKNVAKINQMSVNNDGDGGGEWWWTQPKPPTKQIWQLMTKVKTTYLVIKSKT